MEWHPIQSYLCQTILPSSTACVISGALLSSFPRVSIVMTRKIPKKMRLPKMKRFLAALLLMCTSFVDVQNCLDFSHIVGVAGRKFYDANHMVKERQCRVISLCNHLNVPQAFAL